MLRFLFILLLFSIRLFAQVPKDSVFTTDEIRVSSFFNKISAPESPSFIYNIGKDRIRISPGISSGEVLNNVPGVFIKNYGFASSLQTISLNGLGAEHTVILLNGVKLNSPGTSQFDLSMLPKDNISKIEVLSNGYSSVYGSEALGGVINILTDGFQSKEILNYSENNRYLKVSAGAALGSYNYRKYNFNFDNRILNSYWSFFASKTKSDNNYSYYYNNGINEELKERQYSSFESDNYAVSTNFSANSFKVNLYSQFVNSNKEIPGIETGNMPVKTSQVDKNWNNIISLGFFKNSFSVNSDFNFQNNYSKYISAPFINSFYKTLTYSNLTKAEYNYNAHNFLAGLEIKSSSINSSELESNNSRNQYSIFTSETITFENLIFFPSVRYDYISDIKSGVITYKMGINYKPIAAQNLFLRGSYSSNFNAPSFNALYWKTGGNKELKPEFSKNFEAGVQYALFSGNSKFNLTLDFSYINISADNRIIWLPGKNFIWSPVNVLTSKSEIFNGFTKAEIVFLNNCRLSFEISYQNNKSIKTNSGFSGDPSVNKQIVYIPLEEVKSNIEFKYKDSGIILFYNYLGKRFSDAENLYSMNPVSVLDASVYYTLNFQSIDVEFNIAINNLTNSNYQYIGGYPVPLRNYLFNIKFNYLLK